MLEETSAALLAASTPFVRGALREAREAREAEERLLDEAASFLEGAVAAFERSARAANERGWLAGLAESGEVFPFSDGGAGARA